MKKQPHPRSPITLSEGAADNEEEIKAHIFIAVVAAYYRHSLNLRMYRQQNRTAFCE